jgi:hypothetical protein
MADRRGPEGTEAPEGINRAQQDEGQVLDATDMIRADETMPVGQSDHGRASDPADVIPDDVPDVVDRMEEMVRSGRIDNDAYEGEPIYDDAESPFGDADDTLSGDEALP